MTTLRFGACYQVYCDESCHLENDQQPVMVLGAIWCPSEKVRETSVRIREIKEKHGVSPHMEIKWTKVSPGRLDLYQSLVDYFFDDADLHFRALVVPDKSLLHHERYGQDHDTWYYKMYFDMLKVLLQPTARYRIFLDIKDTRSAAKTAKLHDVLCNNMYDFERRIITDVQTVRSHEVEQVQLADLLIGAVGYANRSGGGSEAKAALVERIRNRSGYALTRTTLLREDKFNLLIWEASQPAQ
ncbi:MAG: DUF3800 domain-containing protein [Thermoleophilia bacterium]|nr:DUF3800 domain-containing protein [Thermoleophilia bacterium]